MAILGQDGHPIIPHHPPQVPAGAPSTPDPVSANAALSELQNRENPAAYSAMAAAHPGFVEQPAARLSDTGLLLHSVGFTGNGPTDFNATVERINRTFEDAYGHTPTPGLVLDMIRSPMSAHPGALQRLWNGTLGAGQNANIPAGLNPQQAHEADAYLSADQTKQQDLRFAIHQAVVASYLSGKDVLTPTVNLYQRQQAVDTLGASLANGPADSVQTAAMAQLSLPVNADSAANLAYAANFIHGLGIDYTSLSGSYEQNLRRVQAASVPGDLLAAPGRAGNVAGVSQGKVETALIAGLSSVRDVQQKLIDHYHLTGVQANGVLTGKWPSVLRDLQSSQSYTLTQYLIQAQDNGFGSGAFDPFNAVDFQTGSYANNADGIKARQELGRYQKALQGRQGTLSHGFLAPLLHQFYSSMPLGFFDRGGFTPGSIMSNVLGGSNDSFGDHLHHPFLSWDNPVLNTGGDIGNIVEQGLMRGGIGGFDALNGAWEQGKVDIFAIDALTGNGSLQKQYQEAGRRLAANPPTWLDIFLNSSNGQQIVAGKLKEMGLGSTDAAQAAAVGNVVSDMAIDIYISKKFSPGAIADLTGARALLKAGSVEERLAIASRNPAIRDAVNSGFDLMRKGKVSQAIRKFDGLGDVFHQRRLRPDGNGGVEWVDPVEPVKPGAEPAPLVEPQAPAVEPPAAPQYNPKIPAQLRSPAQLRMLDAKGELDPHMSFIHSDEGFPANTTPGGLTYYSHPTPVGDFYRVELPGGEFKGPDGVLRKYDSAGEASIRVNPSGVSYIHNLKVVEPAQRTRQAGSLLQESFDLARQKGATALVPDPTGLTEDGLLAWRSLARRVERGKIEGARLEGDAQVVKIRGTKDLYNVVGQRVAFDPVATEDQLVRLEQAAAAQSEDAGRGVPPDALPPVGQGPDEQKLLTIHEAVRQGLLDKQGFSDLVLHHTVVKPNLFNGVWARTLPTKAESLFDPADLRWRLRHPYATSIPHPWRFGRAKAAHGLAAIWDFVDASFPQSNIPGAGLIHNAIRQVRVQAFRAANPNAMPLELYDPANIHKAALEVGMSDKRASVLEFRFGQAVARHDSKDLLAIANELHDAGIAQGRDSQIVSGMQNVFSAGVDRSAEHIKWANASHEDLFGKDGLFANRQWSALSAERTGMTDAERAAATKRLQRELTERGLSPIKAKGVYGGEGESSFFVPGLTPVEAEKLGQMFGQESVLTPRGLLYTSGADAGKVRPQTGLDQLAGNTSDNYTEMHVGGKPLRWSMNFDWEKAPVDAPKEFFRSLPFGEPRVLTQREHIQEAIRRATGDAERELLQAMLPEARNVATPILPEEMIHQFSIPVLHAPIQRTGFLSALTWLNRGALRVGMWNRRWLLTTDPILFFKHATADTARRFIAEGGVRGYSASKLSMGQFERHLAENPQAKASFDALHNLMQNGELRYNLGERGFGSRVPRAFWTRDAIKWAKDGNKQPIMSAAAYVDRRLMSGAYQAWKEGGSPAVRDWFESDPAARRLVQEENLPAPLLAEFVARNMDTIHMADPTFLEEAARVRAEAPAGHVRKTLATWMLKTDRNVPVTGHITEGHLNVLNPADAFDHFTQSVIKGYMTANKMNRGGLFRDLSARFFSDFQKMGAEPDEAMQAAMGIAKKVTRHHMLDLADALKAEQTFRWADYFLTKHRLYWKWILSTMVNRPQLALTVGHLSNLLNQVGDHKGNLTFDLPVHIPGVESQGGRTSYTIPIARLFWLDAGATRAGAFSSAYHAMDTGNWEQAAPFFKGTQVDLTTMDGSLKMAYLLLSNSLGRHIPGLGATPVTSDAVTGYLDPTDAYRFKAAWWRIYSSGQVAGAWKGMSQAEIDQQVTHKALIHMTVTGLWRNSAFTGGYINDPKLTDAQTAIWKAYNEQPDPAKRAQMRAAHPFINGMIGMYTTTPVQHALSNQMWSRFQSTINEHESRQNALLADFKRTGDPKYLFGPTWNAEGVRYSSAIDQLKAEAKKAGAKDWLTQFNRDPLLGLHQNYAAALHDLYPNLPAATLNTLAGKATHRPAWIATYENALKTSLSPAAIGKLPVDDQQGAFVIAAYYKSQLLQFASTPSNQAEKIRQDYYSNVYGPFRDHLNQLYNQANQGLKENSSRGYEVVRQWLDARDHEVKVDGFTFPSAQRMEWLLLPRDAQHAKLERDAYKDWSWMTRFQKHLLGVDVNPGVQAGWDEYNNALYQLTSQYAATHQGSVPAIDPKALLGVVRQVDGQHPGFLTDWTRSQTPAYARLLDTYRGPNAGLYGSTPPARDTWKAFFGQIASTAQGAVGAPLPAGDPARLMVWNGYFRKTVWTQLTTGGIAHVDNGIPLGTPPTKAYPTGGWFWRWAMAQHDTTFKNQFKAAVHADPNFIVKLFTPGG